MGTLSLQGAVISPSDEDSQTFSISGANSEVFRLKGNQLITYFIILFRVLFLASITP